jgi:hypothetical protein
MPIDKDRLRSVFREPFRAALASVSDGEKKELSERLLKMREYAIGRHDYYDRLRSQFVAIAAALLPLSFAIGTFFLNLIKKGQPATAQLKISLAVTCGSLLIAGGYVVLMYAARFSPDFAYRKIANTVSWYHAYASTAGFDEQSATEDPQRSCAEFAEALRDYGLTWLETAATIDSRIAEDIEQVFILFGLQKFRREEAREYARFLAGWLTVAAVGFGIAVHAVLSNP